MTKLTAKDIGPRTIQSSLEEKGLLGLQWLKDNTDKITHITIKDIADAHDDKRNNTSTPLDINGFRYKLALIKNRLISLNESTWSIHVHTDFLYVSYRVHSHKIKSIVAYIV